ncbi:MAG: metal-dependent hydrolase [Candidatus Woesearchaeota archaeon]
MQGRTHLLFGLLLCVVWLEFVSSENALLSVLLILFASVLPDIDEKTSLLGRRVPLLSYFTKHRSFFHSIFFLVICIILLSFLVSINHVLAFSAGFLSHLLLDMLTPMGVKPFWPSEVKLRGFVRVGGVLEKGIFFLFVALFIWLLLF